MLHGSRAVVAEPRRAPRTARLSSVAYAAKTPVVPRVCQDGQTRPEIPETAWTRTEPLTWAFEDAIAPCETP